MNQVSNKIQENGLFYYMFLQSHVDSSKKFFRFKRTKQCVCCMFGKVEMQLHCNKLNVETKVGHSPSKKYKVSKKL